MIDLYQSPFLERYSSKEMLFIFSPQFKYTTFRRLWTELAKVEKELGINISDSQIAELEDAVEKINFEKVKEYEKKFNHDVMAHIHAFGDLCPKAKGIIHLGATSAFVTDNTDIIQMKAGLSLLAKKILQVIKLLASFSQKYADLACVSYTHLQAAQPTTIGKRALLWLQDFKWDFEKFSYLHENLKFFGAKGATGTQASFLTLFKNKETVKKLDPLLAKKFGFKSYLKISGQTYSRKIDLEILNALESFAASAHKFATDLRLLSFTSEVHEHFFKEQVGSSAMPFKRNPILAERICALSRFLISLAQNPAYTLATQWLERSLDDSANRRLVIPESFLAADAILSLLTVIIPLLEVDEPKIKEVLKANFEKLAMEAILMESVKKGEDRQILHAKLKGLALGQKEELIKSIEKDPHFRLSKKELEEALDIHNMVGLSKEQVEEFLKEEVDPLYEANS